MTLQDKVAIVTGAAAGIGAGTAAVFAERGARLVLVDRNGAGLEAVARALPIAQERVVIFAGDVADADTARGAERLARETFGGADVLFNNAGVMTSGDFGDVDEAGWDEVLDINLRGIYRQQYRPGDPAAMDRPGPDQRGG
jgi:NAD(P)-dependent dehydrogenase (short-subunit alcohol dehydrogenase family)